MLKRLFSSLKRRSSPEITWKFDLLERSANEDRPLPFSLSDILGPRMGGVVVHDFLSPSEAASIIRGYHELPPEKIYSPYDGFSFSPLGFSQFALEERAGRIEASEYHRQAHRYLSSFPDQFGVDFSARLSTLFGKIWPDLVIGPAPDQEGEGIFVPFNIREMPPGKGRLISHCGKLFNRNFGDFYSRMQHLTRNDHQVSFFVLLQQPEEGGELTLYNLLWEEAQSRPEEGRIVTLEGKEIDLKDSATLPRIQANLKVGSLIVFNGGDIWHRVETILGSQSRYTLGGFLSLSPDHQKAYFWC